MGARCGLATESPAHPVWDNRLRGLTVGVMAALLPSVRPAAQAVDAGPIPTWGRR